MNILMAAGIFPPDVGGPANFVPRIAQWLTQRGHDVEVVCWSDSGIHDDSRYPFKVRRILRHGGRLGRLAKTVSALYELGKCSDVIFANGLDVECRIATTLLGKPALHKVVGDRAWEIARVRNWYTGSLDDYQTAPKSLRLRLLDKLRDFSLSRAALVVTPSHYLAKIVAGWNTGSRTLQVVYNSTAINQPAGELDLMPYKGKTIATVCRLVPWKGVDQLISALRLIPDTRLVIAGDGPERFKLEQHARNEGLSDRVLFLGRIALPQVRTLLALSDVFILNSGYEGLPHVVLEAMAAHVPVIATQVGGTAELVEHDMTGLLIAFGDVQALVAGTRQLLGNIETRNRLASNAHEMLVHKFTEETCFLSYETALLKMADMHRAVTAKSEHRPT